MPEYLVPRAVRSRMEVFPGFGLAELLAILNGRGAYSRLLTMATELLSLRCRGWNLPQKEQAFFPLVAMIPPLS